jgi:hypothetical protein
LAGEGGQSTAGSALRDKALLHLKQGARMINRDDLATRDGVLVGSRGRERLEPAFCKVYSSPRNGAGSHFPCRTHVFEQIDVELEPDAAAGMEGGV